jgi:hypothetical protein
VIFVLVAMLCVMTMPMANAADSPQTEATKYVVPVKSAPVHQGTGCCVSQGEVDGILTAVIATTAVVVGVGIYFIVRHAHGTSIKGCVAESPTGLQIVSDGDQLAYALTGETGGIKAGERVKLGGTKTKGDANYRKFTVKKVDREYGACVVKAATP